MDNKKTNKRDLSEKRHPSALRSTQTHQLPPKPASQDIFSQTELLHTTTTATDSEPPANLSLFNKKDIDVVADALQSMVNSLRALEKRDVASPLTVCMDLTSDLSVLTVSSALEERTMKFPKQSALQNELKIIIDENIKVFLGENELSSINEQDENLTESKTSTDLITLNQSIQTELPTDLNPLVALALGALQNIWQSDLSTEDAMFSAVRPDKLKARMKCPVYTLTSKSQTKLATHSSNDSPWMRTVSHESINCSNNVATNFTGKAEKLSTAATQTDNTPSGDILDQDKYVHLVLDLKTGEPKVSRYRNASKTVDISPSISEILTWARVDTSVASECPKEIVSTKNMPSVKGTTTHSSRAQTEDTQPDGPQFGRVFWSLSRNVGRTGGEANERPKVAVAEEEEDRGCAASEDEEMTQGMIFNAMWTDPFWK